jgi:hypothetical protein
MLLPHTPILVIKRKKSTRNDLLAKHDTVIIGGISVGNLTPLPVGVLEVPWKNVEMGCNVLLPTHLHDL